MPESVRKKAIQSGTTKAALETAKLFVQPAVHTAITASDILLTGGLAIPTEWAVKKLVNRAQGIQEVEYFDKRLGKMRSTIKVKTLPDGRRQLIKVIDRRVIKPTRFYRELSKELERRKKIENEIRKRMPREARGVMGGKHAR